MQYYVIGPDGAKYGPGDVPTLKAWAADNRLSPQTILEDVNTGQRLPAQQVQGIFDTSATATAQPGTMGPVGSEQHIYQNAPNMAPGSYPRQRTGDDGKTLITVSWICSGVGMLCCPLILCLAGIICAIVAGTQGSKKWI